MKRFIFMVFMFIAPLTHAKTQASCKPFMIKGESVVLSAKKPVLMFIHNLSKSDLWMTHPSSESGESAALSSHLEPNHWSALILNTKSFELNCIESKPGHEQQVPCVDIISVCRWSSVTMPNQTSKTFWAGENMSLPALKDYLVRRGFELPHSSQSMLD